MPHLQTQDAKMRNHDVTLNEYSNVHYWLKKNYGRAKKCVSKTCNKKSKNYSWALIHGKKYEKNRDNFFELCYSCHGKYDQTPDGLERIKKANIGRVWTVDSLDGLRKSLTGKIKPRSAIEAVRKARSKPITILKDGKKVATFESGLVASRKLGICLTSVYRTLRGLQKHGGGYQFIYNEGFKHDKRK